ncbi:MAG: hypothetical protein HY739_13200 [Desulfobacterales bacterium]|nr:hypothetical protein [Desulfobacterales bacterium]
MPFGHCSTAALCCIIKRRNICHTDISEVFPKFYADGLERMEIVIDKHNALPLPYQDNLRIPITLQVGPQQYEAGLRTTPNMPVVWISPDLRDNHGRKVSLARVLTDNGFTKNQRI